MKERIYKYKLDFYYKSLIIYLVTLIIYIIIKGRFFHASFEVVVKDPIIYIIAIFILFFLTMLLANTLRAREIIIKENLIIFGNRFGQREVENSDILGVRFSREKKRSRKDSSGIVSGKILKENIHDFPVYIFLINKDNKFISYSRKLSDSADFRFDEVYEGAYIVFSFADENDNGVYDRGSVEPFLRPEVFRIYDKEIKVKSGWNTDNIFIEY